MKSIVKALYSRWNWGNISSLADWVIEEAIRIQQIPAPTFQEAQRAEYVAKQFKQFNLTNVHIDKVSNVYGYLKGQSDLSNVLIMAHTDTVFSSDTDLTIRREANLIYGPGLGDNSMGVAGMLGLIKALHDSNYLPDCNIYFLATSGEEGLGDLRGARAAFERIGDTIKAVINLEGLAFGHIYNAGIAVHRLHISAIAEGGHSWLHFGRASALHGIVDVASRITRLQVPTQPRTTFNIGMIEGGHAINAIATNAGLWLDMRSVNRNALDNLRNEVYAIIESAKADGLSFQVEIVGDRPAGSISSDHPLVQGAIASLKTMGVAGALEIGSTDGNVPLSLAIPTVTIGVTHGGNAHRLDEYMEIAPVQSGIKHIITLALATASYYSKL